MKSWDNYECDGQMTIDEWLKELPSWRNTYPIPSNEDIPSFAWHYVDEEEPKEDGIYFGIRVINDNYVYTYAAYAKGLWWRFEEYDQSWKKILIIKNSPSRMMAWTFVPARYQKEDKTFKLTGFLDFKGIIY